MGRQYAHQRKRRNSSSETFRIDLHWHGRDCSQKTGASRRKYAQSAVGQFWRICRTVNQYSHGNFQTDYLKTINGHLRCIGWIILYDSTWNLYRSSNLFRVTGTSIVFANASGKKWKKI